MSRVYLAEETRLGRRVVIKVLPPEMSAAVSVERFEREIRLAARLQHPHVVPFLTAGGGGDLLYYVMPYIEGESLRAKLAREKELPIAEAVEILRDAAEALAEAHRQGIVHRDIKPDNILLSRGHGMVADFGVAKAVAESGRGGTLTSIGVALGTPTYMSPEQAVADPHTDHRADIYALGCVAYEMLSGRPPFDAGTPQAMIAAHVTQQPDPVNRYRPTIPAPLAAVVHRCLEKKAADRYQSADELLRALAGVLTPAGVTPAATAPYPATPVDGGTAGRRVAAGHPARVAGYFLLGAIAVLAGVAGLAKGVGLPGWVMPAAIALLAVGLPVMVVTGLQERRRQVARTTGMYLATPTGLPALFTWRRALLGGGLAFAALALVTGAYMAARSFGIGGVGTLMATGALDARDPMVLADFTNRTTDSALGVSVTDALRVDLSQSPVIRLLDAREVHAGLERMQRDPDAALDAELARELAQRENAKAVITGEIGTVGSGFVLTARIVGAADGREMVALRETAKDEGEILAALDRLSKALRERIGESLKSLQNTEPLARATTRSLAALKKYSEGVRLDAAGDYRAAYGALREAVTADSTFAMAWRKLGVVAPRAGVADSIGDDAIRRAYRLRDRLPPLERELAISSYYFGVDPSPDSAIAALRRAQALDPAEPTSGNNLPYLLNLLGRFSEAEPLAREQISRDSSYFAFERLTVSLEGQGRTAEAESVAADFAQRNPTHPAGVFFLADNAFAGGDYARSDSLARLPLVNQPGSPARLGALGQRARALIVQGRLAQADRLLDSMAVEAAILGDSSTVIGAFRRRLAADRLLRPAPRLSPSGFDSILRLPGVSRTAGFGNSLYLGAMTAAEAGDTVTARRLFDEADRHLDAAGRRRVPGRAAAASVLERESGRYDEALRLADQESPTFADPCTRCGDHMRARIWEAAGNQDSALAAYERALTRPAPGSASFEEAAIPLAHRRLGELYEQKGNRAKAAEWYQKFVDL
ncbi:MAG TPA: protein kinase, partial [Gemmatimonadales bacterium]|nr:protein kinase [Gemmatimonadales bacterium]